MPPAAKSRASSGKKSRRFAVWRRSRTRERWISRTLDLDLVRYGDLRAAGPDLTLPHPGLADRDFWRREMEELASHDL